MPDTRCSNPVGAHSLHESPAQRSCAHGRLAGDHRQRQIFVQGFLDPRQHDSSKASVAIHLTHRTIRFFGCGYWRMIQTQMSPLGFHPRRDAYKFETKGSRRRSRVQLRNACL